MQSYYSNIELLRILSACSIVYFHVAPITDETRKYGYVGLIIFLLISTTLLFIKKGKREKFIDFSIKKMTRILVPFLFWSVFYLMVSIYIKGFTPILNKLSWEMILSGTYYHLWYLPFIYFVIIVSYLLKNRCSKTILNERNSNVYFLIGILLLVLQSIVITINPINTLSAQWLSSIPCFFFGIYISMQLNRNGGESNVVSSKFPLLVGGISIATYLLSTSSAVQMYAISYGIGSFIFYLSFYLKRISSSIFPAIRKMSNLTLGVYLIHPVIILMIIKLDLGMSLLLKYFLTLVLSFLFTFILKMIPLLKKVL